MGFGSSWFWFGVLGFGGLGVQCLGFGKGAVRQTLRIEALGLGSFVRTPLQHRVGKLWMWGFSVGTVAAARCKRDRTYAAVPCVTAWGNPFPKPSTP